MRVAVLGSAARDTGQEAYFGGRTGAQRRRERSGCGEGRWPRHVNVGGRSRVLGPDERARGNKGKVGPGRAYGLGTWEAITGRSLPRV